MNKQTYNDLLDGTVEVYFDSFTNEHTQLVILSGSFNPIHKNHIEIARLASEQTNNPVYLEISLTNCDKGIISYEDLEQRLDKIYIETASVSCIAGIIITNQANFVDKTNVLQYGNNKIVFVCGSDTFYRMDHLKYYKDSFERDEALDTLNRLSSFLVAQRNNTSLVYNHVYAQFLQNYQDDGTSSTKIRNEQL